MDQQRRQSAEELIELLDNESETPLGVLQLIRESITGVTWQIGQLTKVASHVKNPHLGLELLLQLPINDWDTYIYNTVAKLYNRIGQFEKTIEILSMYNGDHYTPTIIATAYNGLGQFAKALDALGPRPDEGWNAHYAVVAAKAYIGLGQFEKVHTLFPDADMDSYSMYIFKTKITALRVEKKYTEAITHLHRKLRVPALYKSDAVEFRTILATLYCDVGEYNTAIYSLPYHESDYTTATFNIHAKAFILQRKPEMALDIITKCMNPDHITRILRSRCLNMLACYSEVVTMLNDVPKNSRITEDYNALAVAHTALGKPEIAQSLLQSCVHWNDSTYHAAINAALQQNDAALAEKLCQEALQYNAVHSVSNVLYIRFLLQRNRGVEAVPILNSYLAKKGKPTQAILFCIARLSYLGINTQLFTLCKQGMPYLKDTLEFVMHHAAKSETTLLDTEINDAVRSGFFNELDRMEGNLHPINRQTIAVAANPSPAASSMHI